MNWAPVDLHTVHKCLTNIDVKIRSRPLAGRPPTNSGLATKPKARFSGSTATYIPYCTVLPVPARTRHAGQSNEEYLPASCYR